MTSICLWDPYLDAVDIMHTLYHCSSTSAKLRALGSDKRRKTTTVSYLDWKKEQMARFTSPGNNNLCLDLEFRVSRGIGNGGFHDRFLIFPDTDDGPKAWSLGTSINALGTSHHILQSTSNPQMVADEFFKFWDSVTDVENHVWSTHGTRTR